jgi:hypothetical protein
MRAIVVHDRMQSGYRYIRTAPVGKNFHPEFKPQLTPKEMLELGVFGGLYMTDCKNEFPKSWFTHAKLSPDRKRYRELNYLKTNASQSLSVWKSKSWIHKDDPRGWFQWYCRYYMGRRHEDDCRQIKRWRAITRHISQVVYNCRVNDQHCRPKQRQAILHWAYDPRKF